MKNKAIFWVAWMCKFVSGSSENVYLKTFSKEGHLWLLSFFMVFLNSLLDLSHLWMPVRIYCLSTLRPMIRYVFPRFSSCVQGQSAPFFRYRVSFFRSFFFKGPNFTVFFLFCRITLRSMLSSLTSLILVFMAKENRDMDKVENIDKENSENCAQLSESSPVGGEETEDYIILPVNISFLYFFKLSLKKLCLFP